MASPWLAFPALARAFPYPARIDAMVGHYGLLRGYQVKAGWGRVWRGGPIPYSPRPGLRYDSQSGAPDIIQGRRPGGIL